MADEQSPMEFDADKVPEVLPILPLYDAALFPKMVLPLVVLQGESVQLVDEAMAKDRIIGLMVSKKPEDKSTPGREDLAACRWRGLSLQHGGCGGCSVEATHPGERSSWPAQAPGRHGTILAPPRVRSRTGGAPCTRPSLASTRTTTRSSKNASGTGVV